MPMIWLQKRKEDQSQMPNTKTTEFFEELADICHKHNITVDNIEITVNQEPKDINITFEVKEG